MNRRRPGTDDATRVRVSSGDDELAAALLPGLDDHSGPARRLPQAKTSAMVASIVDAALREPPAADAPAPAPAPAARPPRRLAPVLAVALVAAAVVGAAAAVVTTRYLTLARTRPEAPPTPVAPEPAPPAPAPAAAPEIQMEPMITDSKPAPEPSRTSRKHAVRAPDEPTAAPRPPPALPADAPAEDVLALANQRRKEHAWRDADALYRRVIRRYPRTDAAVVAEVASATLHLEHLNDAAGALAGYRRALDARPAGALGEEARWGIAEAFRAVGDRKGEAFALRVFLQSHPRSAMAPTARKRLAELP
jgi:hypothetical protein